MNLLLWHVVVVCSVVGCCFEIFVAVVEKFGGCCNAATQTFVV